MADIRIKDLATLESASLTGDVFVIDGTTGTRKLSAFSPSFGGNVVVTGTLTTNGNVTINSNVGIIGKSGTGTGGNWRFVSDDGTSRWLTGLLGGSGETSYSIYDSANSRSLLTATAAGVVQINQTTPSTTTSSGALVVSGGVGVAGAIYAGGNITIDKAAPDFTLTRSVNTNSGLIQLTTSTTYDFAIGLRNTTDSDLHIYNYGTSNDALKIARSDSLATFGGAVRTAAPSGGTAANWKLGTVATVSPTSPNRTIEVDIGGTIYYLHAKTTNN